MWEDDLASMSPIPAADQQLDRDLRRDIGAPDVRFVAVATGATQEEVLQAAEHAAAILVPLVAQNAISGYDAPSRYLPSEADPESPPSGVARDRDATALAQCRPCRPAIPAG